MVLSSDGEGPGLWTPDELDLLASAMDGRAERGTRGGARSNHGVVAGSLAGTTALHEAAVRLRREHPKEQEAEVNRRLERLWAK